MMQGNADVNVWWDVVKRNADDADVLGFYVVWRMDADYFGGGME